MHRAYFLIFFLLISLFSAAQNLDQKNNSTQVNFKIKNFGSYVDGCFSDVNVDSSFDLNNLSESYINSEILVKSINTNNEKRDSHLRNEDYFEANTYPVINLVSIKIEKSLTNTFILTAKLTIKNIVKTIQIPIEIIENNNELQLLAKFDINRIDYGVGEKSWVLSNEVKIEVNHTIAK